MSAAESARERLSEAAAAINLAASLLTPHIDLLRAPHETFAELARSERAATEALLGPLFEATDRFYRTYTAQIARAHNALREVKAK